MLLNRQKVIIALLAEVGQPVTRTALVRLVFLLRQETCLRDDASFYDFVPHKFGPFSFSLYRELSSLEADGYLALESERVSLKSGMAAARAERIESLDETARSAVSQITRRFGKLSQPVLLKDVYERYPWYASRSELKDLVPDDFGHTPVAEIAVYTVGYEGKSVDAFFKGLLQSGIQCILDVRANPISRKYGFAKKSLSDIAGKLSLCYHHFPELGIQSEERRELRDRESYRRLLDRYETEMLPNRNQEITQLILLLKAKPSVLVCMEKDIAFCHRGRLAKAAAKLSGLPIVHLP